LVIRRNTVSVRDVMNVRSTSRKQGGLEAIVCPVARRWTRFLANGGISDWLSGCGMVKYSCVMGARKNRAG